MNEISENEYIPLNLWIRQDQMNKISVEAYKKGTTVYSLVRKIIDFYYEHKDLNK